MTLSERRINWRNIPDMNHKFSKSASAIKSCIEADEDVLLMDLVVDDYEAKIFALIMCFTIIPSVKCIEHLIAVNTPLDKTFVNNPFDCTAQEYLDTHFNFTSNKTHTKARNAIYRAIEKGQKRLNGSDHITIHIELPRVIPKKSIIQKVGDLLMSPISKSN